MNSLAIELFREVRPGLFRVLSRYDGERLDGYTSTLYLSQLHLACVMQLIDAVLFN